ncbi:MAG: hypothetical protein JNJ60_03725 [Rhodocyclaceae bacterium]|nr:hypothetical protein [Rhodocyclaceae bacterium]
MFTPYSSLARYRAYLFAAVAALCATGLPAAPLDDINQYADRCAAELGAGAGAYMPTGLFPNPPDFTGTIAVPTFWNKKAITYELARKDTGRRCSDAGAGCNAGNSEFEFLFDGLPGNQKDVAPDGSASPGLAAYPDGANLAGRIKSKADLKCDFWSHVNSENGCLPGQRIVQRDVGSCKGGTRNGAACTDNADCGNGGSCREKITWTMIFRRAQPVQAGANFADAASKEFHPYYFNNMDVIAFKRDTGGTCWFDTFQVDRAAGAKKLSTTKNEWWRSRVGGVDFDGPAGIPRPGGKDLDKKARAREFWNAPRDVKDPAFSGTDLNTNVRERCTACHGNGPVITSRWLNAGGAIVGRIGGEIPFWHAGLLFANPSFKKFSEGTAPAPDATAACRGCHNYWSTSAQTSPGGLLAERMVHDATAWINFNGFLASNYRKQVDDAGTAYAKTCRGGGVTNAKEGTPCAADGDCAGGRCVAGQNAGIMREMPHPFTGTPAGWEASVKPAYDLMANCNNVCVGGLDRGETCANNAECTGRMACDAGGNLGLPCTAAADCPGGACTNKACTGAGALNGRPCTANAQCGAGTCGVGSCRIVGAGCDNRVQAQVPAFFGAQERTQSNPPLEQRIEAPLQAVNFRVARTTCVVAANGAENCAIQTTWQDPTPADLKLDEASYHAADLYYLEKHSVANQAGQAPATNPFCSATLTPANATRTNVAGSNWAKNHRVPDLQADCVHTEVRLCGGYEFDSFPGANEAHAPVDSNDAGQTGRVVTACANGVQARRGGFRLNLASGRYVQSVTLTNRAAVAAPGPISFMLFNLSANATLANAGGATSIVQPAGTPYVNVGGLSAGQSVTITLEFSNPSNAGITYDARIRAGPGDL